METETCAAYEGLYFFTIPLEPIQVLWSKIPQNLLFKLPEHFSEIPSFAMSNQKNFQETLICDVSKEGILQQKCFQEIGENRQQKKI